MSGLSTGAGTPDKVPVRLAAFWGLGSFSATAMLNGVSVVLLFYLVTYVQLEPAVAGALLFGSKLLDLFTDPPMGLISDRTRSRLGRRRPWLLGSSLFCGASFALLFNVPDLPGAGVYLFLMPALALYALSYTAFDVPYMAMAAEMTTDTHERTRIMSWRVVFMTLGNMTGVAVAPNLARAFGGDRAAYGDMGVIFGGLIFVTMLLTFLGTRDARQTQQTSKPIPLKQQLVWLAANRPLIVLVSMKALIYVGISAFTGVDFSCHRPGDGHGGFYPGVGSPCSSNREENRLRRFAGRIYGGVADLALGPAGGKQCGFRLAGNRLGRFFRGKLLIWKLHVAGCHGP